jgi:hypothetical protein
MPIIHLIIVLALVGLLMWLVNTYVPMQPPYKQIMNIVVIVAVILWLLSVFGVLGGLGTVPRVQ